MDKENRVYSILLALMFQFKGYHAGCVPLDQPATYTWPIGGGINLYEISTTSWAGNSSNIGYTSGPSSLNNSALELNGTNKAFIEVPVAYSSDMVPDYAISFHLFVVEDGVFLHYRSDDYADNATSGSFLKSVKMAMQGGNIITTIGNGHNDTVRTTYTYVAYSQWYHVIFQRDDSKNRINYEVGIFGESTIHQTDFDPWIANVPTRFPGTLRFGGSLDGESFFTGRVTCAQIIPCRNPSVAAGYETKCLTAIWPSLTTTTTTPTTNSFLTSYSPPRPISHSCIRYRVAHLNATFSSGILGVFVVDAPLACSLKCSAHGACQSFAFKFRNCMIGPSSPGTKYNAGSILFELV